MIYPISNFRQWPDIEEPEKVLPPPYRNQPGRFKKARKKRIDEMEEKRG